MPYRSPHSQSKHMAEVYHARVKAGVCARCGKREAEKNKKSCSECLAKVCERGKKYHREVNTGLAKEMTFDHYGRTCACCGESNRKFLTVDHVNSDGFEHRKKVTASQIYIWLVTNSFPPGFQILCWNCNCGRQMNNGICPHKE